MRKEYDGDWMAQQYDEVSAALFAPEVVEPVVDFLADLAGEGGRALELGIGTGRIAIPLSRRGVYVRGIDLSQAMVDRLRSRAGSQQIDVTMGDFVTADAGGRFKVVYLVYSTIEDLTTQDEQAACFYNVARHLEAGGCFILEGAIPPLRYLPPGQTIRASTVEPTALIFEEYDIAAQICQSHHYRIGCARLKSLSARYRYVWPSELDLMARLAGMTLRERWGGWQREPFTSESTAHVSVWELRA